MRKRKDPTLSIENSGRKQSDQTGKEKFDSLHSFDTIVMYREVSRKLCTLWKNAGRSEINQGV